MIEITITWVLAITTIIILLVLTTKIKIITWDSVKTKIIRTWVLVKIITNNQHQDLILMNRKKQKLIIHLDLINNQIQINKKRKITQILILIIYLVDYKNILFFI